MALSRPAAVALVALGCFLGSIARYGVTIAALRLPRTFTANVPGSAVCCNGAVTLAALLPV